MLNPYSVVNALDSLKPEKGSKGFPLAINANLMSNRCDGAFIAVSTFIKKGRTVSVINTTVTDDKGKVIANITSNHVASI